mgnify:CR=1 FL=1
MAFCPIALGAAPAVLTTLDNGVRVIVQEDHSINLVAVDVWIKAGSADETSSNNGVSHFIEHLAFKCTGKRAPGQIDMEIESLGASIEARTSRDWTHFYTTVASRYLDKALDVLSDVVTNPKLREEDVEKERGIILDEISRDRSDPWRLLRDTLFAEAFSLHPYKYPAAGSAESVSKISRDTITAFYNSYYTPSNITVVLVGDITSAEGAAAVKKSFGGFKKTSSSRPEIPVEPVREHQIRKKITQPANLAYLAVGFPAPSVKDKPDIYAMDVLVSYLGFGYRSWVVSELKTNKGLMSSGDSSFLTQKYTGIASINVSCEPNKLKDVEDAIFAHIAKIREKPISDFELNTAKRSLEAEFAFNNETFEGRANSLGFYDSIDSFEIALNYVQNIRNVTAEDVLAAAKKYMDPNKSIVVTICP